MKIKIRFREKYNALTHLLASVAALIGLIVLVVVGWGPPWGKTIALLIYGLSLVFQFAASGIYHAVIADGKTIERLRKVDHSAIYLLIAGSYTPICYIMFSGFWKWGMLLIIWSLALIGIIIKIFVIEAPRWVTAGVYVLMGWLSLIAIGEMLRTLPPGFLFWLALGGVIYTMGAVVYITKKMDFYPQVFGFHEVWHIFVILAATAHYIGILLYIAPV